MLKTVLHILFICWGLAVNSSWVEESSAAAIIPVYYDHVWANRQNISLCKSVPSTNCTFVRSTTNGRNKLLQHVYLTCISKSCFTWSYTVVCSVSLKFGQLPPCFSFDVLIHASEFWSWRPLNTQCATHIYFNAEVAYFIEELVCTLLLPYIFSPVFTIRLLPYDLLSI